MNNIENSKSRNIFKLIAIILSIVLLILNIFLYIQMKSDWSEMGSSNEQYENASLIIVGLFRYGTLIWGILLIPIVWLEYFLTRVFMKIYNKFSGVKKVFLCSIIFLLISIILIFFIRMLLLIIMTLV